MRDALQRLAGIAEPPLEEIVPCEPEIFHYRNKLEYSFTQTPTGPALGFHQAGRWDEVLDIEKCWLTTDLGNGIRDAVRDWAREEGLEAYSQEDGTRLSAPPRRAGGAQHRPGARAARDGAGREVRARLLRRRLPHASREVRSVHWSVNDTPAEVTNLPTELLWGEEWIEEELSRPPLPRPPERVPADEHARWPRSSTRSRARRRSSTGGETVWDLYCGIGTIGLSMAPTR